MSTPFTICTNCRTQFDPSLADCPGCGLPNSAVAQSPGYGGHPGPQPTVSPASSQRAGNSGLKKILLIVAGFALLFVSVIVVVLIIVLRSGSSATSNMQPNAYLVGFVPGHAQGCFYEETLIDSINLKMGGGPDGLMKAVVLEDAGTWLYVENDTRVRVLTYDQRFRGTIAEVLVTNGPFAGMVIWLPTTSIHLLGPQ